MTREARTFILKCFCRQVSAVETAYLVGRLVSRSGPIVTAQDVRRIWERESESHPALRALIDKFGERPARGFAACEHTRLAEELVAA